MIDEKFILENFPQISSKTNDKIITYLDSAATTLKPKSVIEVVDTYYLKECANVHRGIHTLSEISTDKYEKTRDLLKDFLGASEREEIIFTKGTTESINLVARTYGEKNIKAQDEIIISYMEHHSNIVPWQMLCEKTGAILKVMPINDKGEILLEEALKLFTAKTKIVSVVYVSNSLGTINSVKEIIEKAHEVGAVCLIDAAQATTHQKIDVQKLDCDFLALSAHKMFGPTGVGALYGKRKLLEEMPPFIGGGDMIDQVTFEKTTYNDLPYKFEAGTPHIAGVIGLGAAIEFINNLGLHNIIEHERKLLAYGTEKLKSVPGLKIIGEASHKASVLSFVIEGTHSHDIASFTTQDGLALRTGHHCTQPLMKRMNVAATARASLSIYNTKKDIDKLFNSLMKMIDIFGL